MVSRDHLNVVSDDWRLFVCPWYKNGEYLGVFLQNEVSSKSESWSCKVKTTFRLLEDDTHGTIEEKELYHVFTNTNPNRGFSKFIAMTELLDPDNDYLKDDKLNFEVHIAADAPEGTW